LALPVECNEIVQHIKYNFHFLSSNKIQKPKGKEHQLHNRWNRYSDW